MGTEVVGNVRRGFDHWQKAARACVPRPHGTSLGVGGVSRPVGTQCSRSPALDRRPRACSIMRTRRYGGEADVACRGTMSRGLTRLKNNSKCTNI
jgi:hypothetical protein